MYCDEMYVTDEEGREVKKKEKEEKTKDDEEKEEEEIQKELSKIFLPGEKICRKETAIIAGEGTYEEGSFIYASITGKKKIIKHTANQTRTVCIYGGYLFPVQPKINSDVLARVTRILPRRVECDILCADNRPIFDSYRGYLRIQDVRKYETDKMDMLECFKPLDIIKAKIIGREGRQFVLSTAEDKYGVLFGTSASGGNLEAVSWRFMRCSQTGKLEFRKTARIFPASAETLKEK